MKHKTMITAHSGCDNTLDNSIEYIMKALSAGVEAFEVDVNRGSDGILYLRHDVDPSGEYKGCPTLEQAFQLMKTKDDMRINCDLKARGIERQVSELAAKAGVADRLIYSGSVGFDFLEVREAEGSKVEVFLNIEEIFKDKMYSLYRRLLMAPGDITAAAKEAADCCRRYNVGVLNTYFRLCTDEFIEVLNESGIEISAWTVDKKRDIVRLLKKGVGNITTRKARDAVLIRRLYYEVP